MWCGLCGYVPQRQEARVHKKEEEEVLWCGVVVLASNVPPDAVWCNTSPRPTLPASQSPSVPASLTTVLSITTLNRLLRQYLPSIGHQQYVQPLLSQPPLPPFISTEQHCYHYLHSPDLLHHNPYYHLQPLSGLTTTTIPTIVTAHMADFTVNL